MASTSSAPTAKGANCRPLWSRHSASASATGIGALYTRAPVIASHASASASNAAPSVSAAPSRPSGYRAVVALVVAAHPRHLLVVEHLRRDVGPEGGVRLDDRVLLLGQAARLLQDRVGHADLADVVQQRGLAHARHVAVVPPDRPCERGRRGRRRARCGCCVSGSFASIAGRARGPRHRLRALEPLGAVVRRQLADHVRVVRTQASRPWTSPSTSAPSARRSIASASTRAARSATPAETVSRLAAEQLGADRAAQALGREARAVGVGVGHEHDDLVAADAASELAVAQAVA